MASTQEPKPAIKKPDKSPPFKAAPEPEEAAPAPEAPPPAPSAKKETPWAPLASAPKNADAVFEVRTSVRGKVALGTETMVCYRATRRRVGGRWEVSLAMIDFRLKTKLGFRPTEWRYPPPPKKEPAKKDA